MSELKKCPKCNKEMTAEEFGKGRICRVCLSANMAKGREARSDTDEVKEAKRPTRIPLTEKRILDYNARDPNFTYRFVNDEPGRVNRMEMAGWTPVASDDPDAACDPMADRTRKPGSVVTMPVGNGMEAVLMKKPIDEFNEDMKPVYEKANEVEQSIFGHKHKPNFYEPDGAGTKIGNTFAVRHTDGD